MVRSAAWLWITAAGLQLVGSALALTEARALFAGVVAEVAQGFPAEAEATRERVAVAVLALLLGAGPLIALLELGCVTALNRGKRWARTVLVLLAGVAGVHAVIAVGGLRSVFLAGLAVASGIAVVAVIVSFLPAARVWFGGGEKR
ncbi:hypothetical protein GCM10010178_04940 [Lentzea flava]|uniref:DoxX-like family protein n=1 Tax=Lentzea flava TaxID=103732 RepID=A0ABQ2UA93_9PSEU|nr:hypothetical protein [Lentzea flava]GGU16307.1 hypothetical protein GCM10010178_04940 [Lentzea flava]